MNVQISWADFQTILPEIVLLAFAFIGLLYGAFSRKKSQPVLPWLMIIGVFAAMGVNFYLGASVHQGFYQMVIQDKISVILTFIFLITLLLTLLLSVSYNENVELDFVEYAPLLVFSTVGMILMAKAQHFMVFFLGLETMSISLYVLAGYRKFNKYSLESALKYFLLGAFASAILLYGIALVYGAVGSTALKNVADFIGQTGLNGPAYFYVGLGLIIVGFGFKVALVPFHMWTPDVYEGAPIPVTAFMAVGAKAAGFAAFIRVFLVMALPLSIQWGSVLWILAVLTMTVGNISALLQNNIKRMLAYSSIAHAGYILVAVVSAAPDNSIMNILFYLMAYALMNFAAFGSIAVLSGKNEKYVNIEDYAGLGLQRPMIGLVMMVAMMSLAGLPPTVGFIGKFYIFSTAVNNGFVGLVIIGVLNSLVSAYYYLRPLVVMYMKEPSGDIEKMEISPAVGLALLITLLGMLQFGLFPDLFQKLF